MGIQHRDKRLLIMNEYKSASMPVSGLHGGRSALGVGTRWAACACSLRVGLQGKKLPSAMQVYAKARGA
jgi:hypothetical protein